MRLVWFLLLTYSLWGGERWQTQFFHDKDREELRFSAIAFCSHGRGIATGVLINEGRPKPMSAVTANGGAVWTLTPTQEIGYALFFLEETAGWMITESGIWFSDECGRGWKRIHKQRGLTDIRFVSRERGWAIGVKKTVIETSDAGKTWQPVKAVQELDASAEFTAFHAIEFINSREGFISARSSRPRDRRVPLWLDSDPESRRERPALSITLETSDGGASWNVSKASMFGRISKLRFGNRRAGLALVEFEEYFEFPSELFALGTGKDANSRVLRQKDFAITDILVPGKFYAAGFEPAGGISRSPIPGRVRIASSANLADWIEADVDYRAVATRVMLAGAGNDLWAATDTGMILKRSVE